MSTDKNSGHQDVVLLLLRFVRLLFLVGGPCVTWCDVSSCYWANHRTRAFFAASLFLSRHPFSDRLDQLHFWREKFGREFYVIQLTSYSSLTSFVVCLSISRARANVTPRIFFTCSNTRATSFFRLPAASLRRHGTQLLERAHSSPLVCDQKTLVSFTSLQFLR